MNIRVALIEDEEDIRKLTVSLLNLYPDIECVGAFPDAESFLADFARLSPDVILMDIELPGISGIECIRAGRLQEVAADIIMFTNNYNTDLVYEALNKWHGRE